MNLPNPKSLCNEIAAGILAEINIGGPQVHLTLSEHDTVPFGEGFHGIYSAILAVGDIFVCTVDIDDKLVTVRCPVYNQAVDIAEPSCFTEIAEIVRHCAKMVRKYHGWQALQTALRSTYNEIKARFDSRYRLSINNKPALRTEIIDNGYALQLRMIESVTKAGSERSMPIMVMGDDGLRQLTGGKIHATVSIAETVSRAESTLFLAVQTASTDVINNFMFDDVDAPEDIAAHLLAAL